jgi:hypothetical protein
MQFAYGIIFVCSCSAKLNRQTFPPHKSALHLEHLVPTTSFHLTQRTHKDHSRKYAKLTEHSQRHQTPPSQPCKQTTSHFESRDKVSITLLLSPVLLIIIIIIIRPVSLPAGICIKKAPLLARQKPVTITHFPVKQWLSTSLYRVDLLINAHMPRDVECIFHIYI